MPRSGPGQLVEILVAEPVVAFGGMSESVLISGPGLVDPVWVASQDSMDQDPIVDGGNQGRRVCYVHVLVNVRHIET